MAEMSAKDYRSEVKPVWCAGCGDYGVMAALTQVFARLNMPKEKIFIASGIGCSSRITGYLDTYGINAIHGRAIPVAQGAKLASLALSVDLVVLAIGGDGDFFSIGAGHLPHAVRRNINITCIMLDNQVYAMTKGQTSPTTPCFDEEDARSIRTSQALNSPVDPLLDMLTFGTKFLAQALATDVNHLADIIEAAILYPGFAFVNVQTHCVSFQEAEWAEHLKKDSFHLKAGERVELPKGESWIHDPADKNLARKIVEVALKERPYYGIIYQKKVTN